MTDLFNSDQGENEVNKNDEAKDNLDLSMIGDGKKYKSVEDADKALFHSQQHIDKIQTENAELVRKIKEMEEQLVKSRTIDDVLSRLDGVSDSGDEKPLSDHTQPVQQLSKDDIMHVVDDIIKTKERSKIEEQNRALVKDELIKLFGDKAADKAKEVASAYKLDLNQLASVSPQAVLRLFNAESSERARPVDTSSINTQSLGSSNPGSHKDDPAWKAAVKDGKFKLAAEIAMKYLT